MKPNIKTLLKNTLIAQALGDAFGYIVEFKQWEQIKDIYGEKGLQYDPHNLNLIASDDTQMSLFCLEGLIAATGIALQENRRLTDPTDEIFASFQDWHKTQVSSFTEKNKGLLAFKELFYRRAPGNTCMSALGSRDMGTVKHPLNDSKGCGGIMRTIPIAFYALSAKEAFDWGVKQAAITHGHPDGYLSAGIYSAIVYELIHNTSDLMEAIKTAERILMEYPKSEMMVNVLHKTIWAIKHMHGLENNALTQELGEGWVGDEALSVALYCAATSLTFKEVLEKSSNHSGDSDSTAMLAAGLWYLMTRDEGFLEDIKFIDLTKPIHYLISLV